MINDLETSDDPASQDVVIHSVSSLAISPDLNALLEHDERTRGSYHQLHAAQSLYTPFSPGGSEFPAGLPPPPRSNRKVKSRPTTPKKSESAGSLFSRQPDVSEGLHTSFTGLPTATAISNPFINTPPKLHRPHASNEQERSSGSASEFSGALEMSESLRKALDSPASATESEPPRDFFHSLRSNVSTVTAAQENSPILRPPDRPNSTPLRTSMPRVEKLIGKGKSIFSMSTSHSQSNSRAALNGGISESAGTSPLLSGGMSGNFPEFSFQSSTLFNHFCPFISYLLLLTSACLTGSEIHQTHDGSDWSINPLATISSSRSSDELNKSPRAASSHWSHSRGKSRTRSGSYSSLSTQSPTMDMEPCISISSPRYTSSYPESLYSSDGPPDSVAHGNRDTLAFASPDRDSFIDPFSPSSPEFSIQSYRPLTLSSAGASQHTPSAIKHSIATSPFSDDQSPVSPTPSSVTPSVNISLHKPPVPTTPKPSFKQYSLTHPPDKIQRKTSPMHGHARQPSPNPAEENQGPVPPTTNFLSADKRSDLVKKSRKLAQVFGTTPGAADISQKHDKLQPDFKALPSIPQGKGRHVHGTVSVSGVFKTNTRARESKSSWTLPEDTQYMTASGRRHSEPLSPDEFPFLSGETSIGDAYSGYIEIGSQKGVANRDWSSIQASNPKGPDSPASFMDLSEEDVANDDSSTIMAETPAKNVKRPGLPHSPSTPETLTLEEQEEVERKRKRDKLAKLHRFLGSRVPVELILGVSDGESFTPPALQGRDDHIRKLETVSEHGHPKAWLTRRRSSSSALYSNRSHNLDRLKEELNDEEKAIYVRRAQKMEKVRFLNQIIHVLTSLASGVRCPPTPNSIYPPLDAPTPRFSRRTIFGTFDTPR